MWHTAKHSQRQSIQRQLFKLIAMVLPMMLLAVSLLMIIPISYSVNADDDFLQGLGNLILTYMEEQNNDPDKLYDFLQKTNFDESIHFILWDKDIQIIIAHSDKNFSFQSVEDDFINTVNLFFKSLAGMVWQ